MDLYLLRHAIGEARDHARYPDDGERPLSEEGVRKMKQIAKGMRAFDLEFDLILTSPYARSRQTAEIVAEAFKWQDRLEETPHLEPGGDPEKLIKELKAREGAVSSVLLVGHEPYLSELASVLISGGENSAITLKKGAFCKLVARSLTYGRCATLEFLLSPGQVRRLR